jgi:hypothetical protein
MDYHGTQYSPEHLRRAEITEIVQSALVEGATYTGQCCSALIRYPLKKRSIKVTRGNYVT